MPFDTGERFLNRPYAPKQKRRGRPPGRPTENRRFSATRPLGGGRDVEDAVPYKMDQATTPAVIARPQAVAIPSIFRASLVPRDCHVALRLLAMTWYVPMPFVIGGRFLNRPYKFVGSANTLCIMHSAFCISPPASPVRPRMPRRSGNLSPYLRCFCGQIPPPIGRLRGRLARAELRRW